MSIRDTKQEKGKYDTIKRIGIILLKVIIVLYQLSGIVFLFLCPENLMYTTPMVLWTAFVNISGGTTLLGVIYTIFAIVLILFPVIGILVSKTKITFVTLVFIPYITSLLVLYLSVIFIFITLKTIIICTIIVVVEGVLSILLLVMTAEKYETKSKQSVLLIIISAIVAVTIIALTIVTYINEKSRYEEIVNEKQEFGLLSFETDEIYNSIFKFNKKQYEYNERTYDRRGVKILTRYETEYLYYASYYYWDSNEKQTYDLTLLKKYDVKSNKDTLIYTIEDEIEYVSYYDYFVKDSNVRKSACVYDGRFIYNYEKNKQLVYDYVENQVSILKLDLVEERQKFKIRYMYLDNEGLAIKTEANEYKISYTKMMNDIDNLSPMVLIGQSQINPILIDDELYLMIKTTSKNHFIIARVDSDYSRVEALGVIRVEVDFVEYLSSIYAYKYYGLSK